MQHLARGQTEISVVSYALAFNPSNAFLHSFKYVVFDDARRYMWRPNLYHMFRPLGDHGPPGLLLDDFYTRPCTIAEVCTLAVLVRPYAESSIVIKNLQDGGFLQAHIMDALDPFNFTDAVVDRLLRPQLMDALRHAMCKSH